MALLDPTAPPPTNPILDELSGLSPEAKAALIQAHSAAATPAATSGATQPAAAPPAASPAPMRAPGAAPVPQLAPAKPMNEAEASAASPAGMSSPSAGAAGSTLQPPAAGGAPNSLLAAKSELARKEATGPGVYQILDKVENSGFGQKHPLLGKILGGAAEGLGVLGNIGLDAVEPAVSVALPGTDLHHDRLVRQGESQIANREAAEEKEAQTRNLDLSPELRLSQQRLAQEKLEEKTTNDQGKLNATLAQHGYTVDETDPTGQKLRPLRYEEMNPQQQAVTDLRGAQEEAADATAALKRAQNDPSSPAYRLAQGRLDVARKNAETAIQRLGLSAQEFSFNQDKFYEPQPTASERGKGDLAQSALERIQEMKGIVAKHPEYFGPVAGRSQNAQAWLGSSDPDAVTYNTAAQYLADHSAGVFGGRGQYITQALHDITNPRYTPEGLKAALDEAERAAQGFVKAGTVHGKGGSSSYGQGGGSSGVQTFTDGGVTYNIPAAQVADFKRDHPNAR